MFCWRHTRFFSLFLLFFSGVVAGQSSSPVKSPKDEFSRAFLYIYKNAATYFDDIKGKDLTIGSSAGYTCRKNLPGCRSAFITAGLVSSCIFDFGQYETYEDAQAAMVRMSTKVSAALLQNVIIRYIDSTGDKEIVKRTAMAQIKGNGFYGYNIMVDVIKKSPIISGYGARLTIAGGEGTFYQFIPRGEPTRSPFFQKSFQKLKTQFDEANSFYCAEQLPGFTCVPADSAGKPQLMMIKKVADLPDAKMEIGCLTCDIKAMLGQNFLYYCPPPANETQQAVTFIRYIDHDLQQRKSITASLEKDTEAGYVIKVVMYHP